METAAPRRTGLEKLLIVTALLSAALLAGMVIACLPYFGDEPEIQAAYHEETQTTGETTEETTQETTEETEPETTEETEPTLPPPEANPYGPNDFQYNERNYLTCTAGEYMNGIDVSSYQGNVDWQKVKDAGVEFAMIRVGLRGYGTGKIVEDPNARANLDGATAAGVKIGVYIFSQALNPEEAAEEAAFLLDIIKDYDITMPVVYDWEQVGVEDARTANMDAEALTASTLEFCRIIEEAGYQPMVYFNRHQAKYLLDLSQLTDYPFWLAAYTDRMRYAYKVQMWQYTDSGRVPGIEGSVDMNIWFVYTSEEE